MSDHLSPPALFKSLADETRARAVLLITEQGELCALGDSQPKISRHLAQLRTSGLLQDRRQGQWVYYRLAPDLPQWVHDVLAATLAANRTWLQQDASRLANMGDRPARLAACC